MSNVTIPEKIIKLELTVPEVLSLDGKVNEKAQKEIDHVKEINQYADIGPYFLQEIINTAVKTGKLRYKLTSMSSCPVCKTYHSYHKFKSGPRKGQNNHDRPIFISGYKFFPSNYDLRHSGDLCKKCDNDYRYLSLIYKYILENDLEVELPEYLDFENRYIKDIQYMCYYCDLKMYRSEMKVGYQAWPSICPHCGRESSHHRETKEFRMIKK